MLCLLQTSESEEGPSAHEPLTHFGKLTQACQYIYRKKSKMIKQWNSTVEYPYVKKTNYK